MTATIFKQRYQIQQELGRKIGCKTWRAIDLQTQQPVVVKLLLFGEDFDWQDLKLFEREAEILKTLDRPDIPRYLDYFEIDTPTEQGFALVQTYVADRSLEAHVQAGRTFSEAEVKHIARSLLAILQYLHAQQPPIIHRDIKPSNILLSDRSGNSPGCVYLVDFGSVQTLAAAEGGTITVVGTYGYMPPEQFGGRCVPASDLYGLGATLIYLATGLHPTELPQQALQIQFRQAALQLSPAFADWLGWMTEPSLDRRLASASAALSALEKPRSRSISSNQPPLEQPRGSKIQVKQTSRQVEIRFPASGSAIGFLALSSLSITALLSLLVLAAGEGTGMGDLILLLLAAAILLGWCVWGTIWAYKQVRVKIDATHVFVAHHCLGRQWLAHPPILRRDIDRVAVSHLPKVPHSVTFFTAKTQYSIPRSQHLTLAEQEWLAQEIDRELSRP
jgi:serine/threonine protein kinase